MKKEILTIAIMCSLSAFYGLFASAQASHIPSYNAGGVPIKLPDPNPGFTEVGYDIRELMEIYVPTSNRLLCALVKTNELPLILNDEDFALAKYALVQVPRNGEYENFTESDFTQLIDELDNTFSEGNTSYLDEAEDEFNRRMKSLDLNDMQIDINQPVQLGKFYHKNNIYGLGMLVKFKLGDHEYT